MQRDFESKYDEAVADAYYEQREAERAADTNEDDDETGGFNFGQLAAWARARGDVAEAEKWEAKAAAQDAPPAPVQYSVTMTEKQYIAVWGALLTAKTSAISRLKTAKLSDLSRAWTEQDLAEFSAAKAILDSLQYRRVA